MRREMNYLKIKFSFLENDLNYKIIEEYKAYTYFYIVWSNGEKNIKIVYDFVEDDPIGMYIYDFDDTYMFYSKYYSKELNIKFLKKDNYKNYKMIIDFAAQKIIENNFLTFNDN